VTSNDEPVASSTGVPLAVQAPGDSFDVSFPATPSAFGLFVNPRSGGICMADPSNNIVEGNELNNSCVDSVMVLSTIPIIPSDAAQVIDPANLRIGDSVLNITNTGVRNGFDPAGGICANMYVFDASEELISCCSCYVTPDGLHSLSVNQDLLSNTLTPGAPDSVVIRILASAPVTGSTCNPSSPAPTNLEAGLRAWGTTLHPNTSNGRYEITEAVSQLTPLSLSELTKLTAYCGFIQSNGSGFGICKSCRLGGLGGAQR
jgi:hypothetical protein